ncbi:MAG: SRPBCC domain-containing protein, partial [Hyphomicrobiales bacterium]
MQSDFAPTLGHKFRFTAEWGGVDCAVKEIEPNRTLSYSWDAHGLESTVTWTLIPTETGTQLRMEQTGFRPDQNQAFHGARMGWQQFFGNLETLLASTE